jgi:hypothetical protein
LKDKKKILFWITGNLMPFGLAHTLSMKTDYELYAIIDMEKKTKKFFTEQDIIPFKKIWFLDDHIKIQKKKPNLDYLKSFEKKYDIRLWKIVYFEKLFLKYNKYHKFSHDEILSLLEDECKFFEKIVDDVKPDFFSLKLTDSHDMHLLYEICKSKGTKILMLMQSKLGSKYVISNDDFLNLKNQKIEHETHVQSFDEAQKFWDQKKRFNEVKKVTEPIISIKTLLKPQQVKNIFHSISFDSEQKLRFDNYGKNKFNVLFKMGSLLIKSRYRKKFIDTFFKRSIPKQNKFIYFPLIYEPGRILLMGNYFYTNQLDIIENIAKSLPVDYELFVKEAPGQEAQYWREISFYKKILAMPNVKLIHPSVNHYEMIKNCSIVISIPDSYGLEAAFFAKPSIVFGRVDNSDLSSVHRINRLEDLSKIINSSLKEKVDLKDVNKFIDRLKDNSIELDTLSLSSEDNPFYGHVLPHVEVINTKVKRFLNNRKTYFDILADEHIKKIQSFSEIKPNGSV